MTNSEHKRRSISRREIVIIAISTIIAIAGFFIAPMIKNPVSEVAEVKAAIQTKLDKSEFDRQCSITKTELDKKVDKDTFVAAINANKDMLDKVYGEVKYTRKRIDEHMERTSK
jgi:uncharacterized membrane protein YvbJ